MQQQQQQQLLQQQEQQLWEGFLLRELRQCLDTRIRDGTLLLGVDATAAGEAPLLRSVPHWARMRGPGLDDAACVLGPDLGQRLAIVRGVRSGLDVLNAHQDGRVDRRGAVAALLVNDVESADLPLAYLLVREVGETDHTAARRAWVVGMLKAAFPPRDGWLRGVVEGFTTAVAWPEWRELLAYCGVA